MYGQVTGDTYRPSAQVQDDPATANDRRNRDTFKTQNVRDVIVCGECSKPRCVYSDKKLTREQVNYEYCMLLVASLYRLASLRDLQYLQFLTTLNLS